jgi:hypothetical protein
MLREECRQAFSQLDSDRPFTEVVLELDLFLSVLANTHHVLSTLYGIPVSACCGARVDHRSCRTRVSIQRCCPSVAESVAVSR